MKKLVFGLATAVAMMFAVQSNAQEGVASVGVELAVPMGDFGDAANFGYGVSAQYEFGLTSNIALNLNAGAIFYAMEMDGFSFTHIPIQVGARYYLSEQREGLFLGLKAGLHLGLSKMDDFDFGGITVEGGSDSDANFSFAPEVGYYITENISLGLRYQLITAGKQEVSTVDGSGNVVTTEVDGESSSYLGLRVAFNF